MFDSLFHGLDLKPRSLHGMDRRQTSPERQRPKQRPSPRRFEHIPVQLCWNVRAVRDAFYYMHLSNRIEQGWFRLCRATGRLCRRPYAVICSVKAKKQKQPEKAGTNLFADLRPFGKFHMRCLLVPHGAVKSSGTCLAL